MKNVVYSEYFIGRRAVIPVVFIIRACTGVKGNMAIRLVFIQPLKIIFSLRVSTSYSEIRRFWEMIRQCPESI